MQPSCTDIQLSYQQPERVELLWTPESLPAIFNGNKFVVYGILQKSARSEGVVTGTVSLSYTVMDRQIQHKIPLSSATDIVAVDGGSSIPTLHHLAAKSLLQDWQSGAGLKGLTESNRKQEIIRLSVESSVVSSLTAYVAIQEQGEPVQGALRTWDVKSLLTEQKKRAILSSVYNCPPEDLNELSAQHDKIQLELHNLGPGASCGPYLGGGSSQYPSPVSPPKNCTTSPPKPIEANATPAKRLSYLIRLQQADGSWALDAVLASILGRSVPDLEAACPVRCEGDVRTIWATVLAVEYLETRHGAQRDEWELVAMKAESWLQGQSPPDLQQLKDTAKQFISSYSQS